jgi:hypothetical protein
MDTNQHEWILDGRTRHSVRAATYLTTNGAHRVTRPTLNAPCASVFIRG